MINSLVFCIETIAQADETKNANEKILLKFSKKEKGFMLSDTVKSIKLTSIEAKKTTIINLTIKTFRM